MEKKLIPIDGIQPLSRNDENLLTGGYKDLVGDFTLNLKNNGGKCTNINCSEGKNNRSECSNTNCQCECRPTPPPPPTYNPYCPS